MNSISSLMRAAMLVVVLAFGAGIGVQSASAAVVVVGNCATGVQFSTIQGAIDAVPGGSTVKICPNTYHEQLMITKKLTLTGVPSGNSDAIVITSPVGGLTANTTSLFSGNPIAAHILVDTAPGLVIMNNLIVDSAGNNINSCAPELIGIFYRNSSGTVNHVVTRNQWVGASESDTNFNGCQTGLGIFAQSGNSGASSLTVANSSVHDYQKNGITGNEAGTTLIATGNDVVGQGPTNGAAENGIQIGFGASGTVSGNTVIDDIWLPDTSSDPGDAAAGILLVDTVNNAATVKLNTVGNTQFGIVLSTGTAGLGNGVSVTGNKVVGTRIFDGIDVCSNNNIIQTNTVTNSSESAIHLDASCGSTGNGNTVTSNTLTDGTVGVLKDNATSGNNTTPNTFFTQVTTDPAGNTRTTIPYKPARP